MTVTVYVEGWDDETNPQPEVNLANDNWCIFFDYLKLDLNENRWAEGQLKVGELADRKRLLISIVNSLKQQKSLTRVGKVFGRVTSFGLDSEYMKQRAKQLLEVFESAQKSGVGIYWA